MDPVLPPGPEWLRRRQLIEERKVADLERRLRAPSVRSLADLDDTAIDYLSEPPEDGDTLVFDEALGNDLSPAGRWRPGAGGGGGGGEHSSVSLSLGPSAPFPSVEWQQWSPSVGPMMPVGGPFGVGVMVPVAGVYHASLVGETSSGSATVTVRSRQIEHPMDGPGHCFYPEAGDEGDGRAAVSIDLPCPASGWISAEATGVDAWWRLTVHLVHRAPFVVGTCT